MRLLDLTNYVRPSLSNYSRPTSALSTFVGDYFFNPFRMNLGLAR
jgi:hypothetical protein